MLLKWRDHFTDSQLRELSTLDELIIESLNLNRDFSTTFTKAFSLQDCENVLLLMSATNDVSTGTARGPKVSVQRVDIL